jgi:hypothetical protein
LFEFRTVELEFLLQPAASRTPSEAAVMSLEVIMYLSKVLEIAR